MVGGWEVVVVVRVLETAWEMGGTGWSSVRWLVGSFFYMESLSCSMGSSGRLEGSEEEQE